MSRALLIFAVLLGLFAVAAIGVLAAQDWPRNVGGPSERNSLQGLAAGALIWAYTVMIGLALLHVAILLGLAAFTAARPSAAVFMSGLAFFVAATLIIGLFVAGIYTGGRNQIGEQIAQGVSIVAGLVWLFAWISLLIGSFLPLRHRAA